MTSRSRFTPVGRAAQLADAMRTRLGQGAWGESLPGIFPLMREFGVGRPTVERALALLVESGDISPGGAGRPMRVVRAGGAAPRRGSLVLHDMDPSLRARDTREAILAAVAELPAPVTWLSLDSHMDPAEVYRRACISDAHTVLVLEHAGEVADRLAAEGRRVIALGPATQPKRVPTLTVSHRELIREAHARAFAAGHRRVCTPLWRRAPEVAERVRGWIAEDYRAAGLRHSPAFDAPVVEGHAPAALHDCIRELFRLTPPSALILHDFRHWLAVSSTLASLGLRVPRDVSLILLCQVEELENATPSTAHFRYPVDRLVAAFRRMLRTGNGGRGEVSVALAPAWVPGDSLAPPPAHVR